MVWDLRNARAPEKVVHHFLVTSCPINAIFQILTGHDKGVLPLSWCKQDADLLLSCGKDNRALAGILRRRKSLVRYVIHLPSTLRL